jgi:hypothetical protein
MEKIQEAEVRFGAPMDPAGDTFFSLARQAQVRGL